MTKRYILILDDENLASSYLKETIEIVLNKISIISNFEIIESNNFDNFSKLLKNYKPDIIFLDVEMPNKNGLEVASYINQKKNEIGYQHNLPLIIFSTAYDKYAYQAFKTEAFDYLLKPVDPAHLEKLLLKIQQKHSDLFNLTSKTVNVQHNGVEIHIPENEILYFKADMKYITVVTSKKEFLLNDTLLNLQNKFDKFVRTHRAFLVNPYHINNFLKQGNNIILTLKNYHQHLPVSRRQKQEIEKKINFSVLFQN